MDNLGSPFESNLVAGQDPTGLGSITQYFNVAAFAVPAPYTFGNSGRLLSYLRAPGLVNLDLSLLKDVPIHEQLRRQFRFEVFNVMNHPQFDYPNTTIGSPTAGVMQSQGAHAALSAALLAKTYGPRLKVRGTVATGVPGPQYATRRNSVMFLVLML